MDRWHRRERRWPASYILRAAGCQGHITEHRGSNGSRAPSTAWAMTCGGMAHLVLVVRGIREHFAWQHGIGHEQRVNGTGTRHRDRHVVTCGRNSYVKCCGAQEQQRLVATGARTHTDCDVTAYSLITGRSVALYVKKRVCRCERRKMGKPRPGPAHL